MNISFPTQTLDRLTRGSTLPTGNSDDEFTLDMQCIVNLVSTPDLFFDMNPSFIPLKQTTIEALNKLLDAGIITYASQEPKKRGGCGGCARRKVLQFARQFTDRFHLIVMEAQKDVDDKVRLERNLRAYLLKKGMELRPEMDIVTYPKSKSGGIQKVVL